MDTECESYLERLRAHRAELGDAMHALDDALALPAGLGELWRRRVRAALTELAHDLRDHVELTETGGLYVGLRARAPRLASALGTQMEEHAHFRDEVARLLDARDAGQACVDPIRHRADVGQLLARVARHRQRGSDLVYEAYEVDLGGSG